MGCGITDPLGCIGQLAGSTASSAWDAICLSFAAAADVLLKAFARAFINIPPVDLTSPGVKNVYAICLGIAAVVAGLLLLGQVIRTAFSHDGTALAEGLAGIGKAAAAFLLTLAIASAAVTAADTITSYIISRSFGSVARLTARITTLLSFAGTTGHPAAELAGGVSLLLLLAIIGILLTLVLWFELLLRNAAIAVLIATSPIAAAGLVSAPSRSWWPKMAAATGQLIILKPVIALVFVLGLELTGTSHDIETLLAGMLVLLLAAVAWPVIARFFTFAAVSLSGSTGLGMVLGFAAARLSYGGSPSGAGLSGTSGHLTGAGEAAGAEQESAAAAAGAATAAVLALAKTGVQAAHKMTTALAGRMDQVAGHAGLTPNGYGYQNGQGWAASGQARSAQPWPVQRLSAWSRPEEPGQSALNTDITTSPGAWQADVPVTDNATGSPAPDWPDPGADLWDWPRENPAPGRETPLAGGQGAQAPGTAQPSLSEMPSASSVADGTVPPAPAPGSPPDSTGDGPRGGGSSADSPGMTRPSDDEET